MRTAPLGRADDGVSDRITRAASLVVVVVIFGRRDGRRLGHDVGTFHIRLV